MRFKFFLFTVIAGLVGVYLFLYLPSLPFPYQFDDASNVIDNRAIRYLAHPRIFIESEHSRNRPLTSLSFALSYAAAGLSLSALRAPSLLFHALNALLVGLFFFRLFRRREGAALGGVLAGGIFLLHPLAVDSVVYLSGRSSLMVLLFLLCALWCYGRERPGFWSWLGFMIAAAAAFLTKESALALLPLLLLYHAYLGRRWVELLPYCAPLLAAGAAGAILKWPYLVGASSGFYQIGGDLDIFSIRDYWPIAVAQWPNILRLFFRPDLQAIDHQISFPDSWKDPNVLCGLAVWATLPVFFYALRKSRAPVFFCVLWIFGALSITNSIFPVLDPFAERHLYLALPAFAWLFTALFLKLASQTGKIFWAVPFSALLAVAVFATAPRIAVWQSTESLWQDAYQKYPKKFRIVFNTWSARAQRFRGGEEALPILLKYLEGLRPGNLTFEEQEIAVRSAASVLHQRLQREGGSIWKRGAALLGGKDDFWNAVILLTAGLNSLPDDHWLVAWEAAAEKFQDAKLSARTREPNLTNNTFYLLRAQYYAKSGNRRAAIADYENVFAQFPGKYFPYWTKREELGDLYMLENREPAALLQYELAALQYRGYRRFPPSLYRKLAQIFRARKDILRTADALGQLVRVHSDDPALRQEYAELLRAKGDKAAMQQTKEAEFYSEHSISPLDLREAVSP
ncbi:MAG: hypothetical protein AB7K68_12290 [Bacteriovoracia bacterium]